MIKPMEVAAADYKARCWVQGVKLYKFKDGSQRWEPIVANFHARFHEHPWVREAITEGWDRDLRGHIVPIVRKHLLMGGELTSLKIEDLMPDGDWIKYAKAQAERDRLAAEWRERMVEQYGSMDAYFSKTASRRKQSNVGSAAAQVIASLTPRSKAMTGEGE
jgi:hypothetical protein